MTNNELFHQFKALMPQTTRHQFNELLAAEDLTQSIKGNSPDLLRAISARLHKLAGEHGEPVSNFDREASLLVAGL